MYPLLEINNWVFTNNNFLNMNDLLRLVINKSRILSMYCPDRSFEKVYISFTIKMNWLILQLQLILLLTDSVQSQLSNDTVTMWTGQVNGIRSGYLQLLGNPQIYIQNVAKNNYEFNDSYQQIMYTSNSNITNYQCITYDIASDFLAISESSRQNIIINRYFNIPSFYNVIGHFPLSDNIPGLAFAMSSNLLYWVDAKFRYIGVIELSTFYWTRIVYSNLETPYSIAIHEGKSFIFWTDIGLHPKIERSNLLGEYRTVIKNGSLSTPINLVIDKTTERLFWLDGTLNSCDFNGDNFISYTFSNSYDSTLTSFVMYKEIVIFGTTDGAFLSYRFDSSNVLRNYTSYSVNNFTSVRSGVLDSKTNTTPISNPCPKNTCNHICIPVDSIIYKCLCSFGYSMGTDKKCYTAPVEDNQLLVGDYRQGRIYKVDRSNGNAETIMDIFPHQIINIAYGDLSNSGYVYYVEEDNRIIYKFDVTGKIHSSYGLSSKNITDIATDQTTGDVYYSNIDSEIYQISSSGIQKNIIDINNGNIFKVNVYSSNNQRRMYYSECASRTVVEYDLITNTEIQKFSLFYCAWAMAFDFKSGYGYFSDNIGNIYIYNLKQKTEIVFYTNQNPVVDMALDNDYLYFIDNTNYVFKIAKETKIISYLTQPIFSRAYEIALNTGMSKGFTPSKSSFVLALCLAIFFVTTS